MTIALFSSKDEGGPRNHSSTTNSTGGDAGSFSWREGTGLQKGRQPRQASPKQFQVEVLTRLSFPCNHNSRAHWPSQQCCCKSCKWNLLTKGHLIPRRGLQLKGKVVPTLPSEEDGKFPAVQHPALVQLWGPWGKVAASISLTTTPGQTQVGSVNGTQPWIGTPWYMTQTAALPTRFV